MQQSLFPGTDRWVVVHRDEQTGSEVWSRKDDKDGTRPDLLRVNATIKGVDAATAFQLFYKMDERAAWDTYTQARVLADRCVRFSACTCQLLT